MARPSGLTIPDAVWPRKAAEERKKRVPLRYPLPALRTVEEYNAKVEYIHWNPVKAGLVSRPAEWPWSSVHDYTGSVQRLVVTPGGLAVDRVLLRADERTRM
ncbi:MAG: hypothetical protein ACRD3O_16925 [Terriglobia bacterium]